LLCSPPREPADRAARSSRCWHCSLPAARLRLRGTRPTRSSSRSRSSLSFSTDRYFQRWFGWGHEVDSDFEFFLYPGIIDSGRLRGELDARIRREIAKNLFLELSGYYSFDDQPSVGAEESDYGINTSLGWSF
jgi:hypothetical protein